MYQSTQHLVSVLNSSFRTPVHGAGFGSGRVAQTFAAKAQGALAVGSVGEHLGLPGQEIAVFNVENGAAGPGGAGIRATSVSARLPAMTCWSLVSTDRARTRSRKVLRTLIHGSGLTLAIGNVLLPVLRSVTYCKVKHSLCMMG